MKQVLLANLLAALVSTMAAAQPAEGGGAGGGGQDVEQALAQAEKAYEALEYEAALKVLVAVVQAPAATPMQKARAFLYLGVCFTALGNADNAVAAFMELLKLKPGFRLPPGVSPSIQAMFKEALKRMKLPENPPPEGQGGGGQPGDGGGPPDRGKGADTGVAVDASVVGTAKAGRPVEIKIELTDPRRLVQDVVLHWRLVGGADYSVIRLKYKPGQTTITGRIPGGVLGGSGGRLQYAVELLGRGGLTLGHAGTHASPLEADIEAAPKARSRWGWYVLGIGGGAAVVGGIVAAILLTRGTSQPPPATNGTVSVTIH